MSTGALRKPTNITARAELIEEARSFGVNLSQLFEEALEARLRDERRRRWIEDNREAFADYDAYVRENGVFGDGERLF